LKFSLTLISEKDLRVKLSEFLALIKRFKGHLYSGLALALVTIVFILIYFGIEYYFKTRKVPLVAIRSIITSTINKELSKAVDLGVVDFSLREGLILEDLLISSEEDFSFNTHLLKVKKVTFHVSSYFTKVPQIDRIDFFSPELTLANNESLEKNLLNYFKSTKVKEVIFHNTRVNLKKGDITVLDWKEGWDIRFYRQAGKIIIEYDNGMFWVPNTTRVRGEGYLSETNENDFKFSLQWKNYPSEEAPLVASYLLGTPVQDAVLLGMATWERQADGSNFIKGDVEFENSNFIFPLIPSFMINGLRFKEKFFFEKSKETRDFSSLDFQMKIEDEILPGKEELLVRKIQFNVDDLEPITSLLREISSGESLPLHGKIRGNIEMKETGEKNKWFQTRVNIGGDELEWQSELLTFQHGTGEFKIGEGNNLTFNLKGELFNKPLQLDLTSVLDWTRSKKADGTFYYPLNSKTKANLKVNEIYANNWYLLYDAWKKETLDEIKERQEKLIPEEYFYQKKIYKYILESTNLDFTLLANQFFPYEGSATAGELKGNFLIKDGRWNMNLLLPESGSKITINSYFATKTPNFSFALLLNAYPWHRTWSEICGMNIVPENVNLDYSFASQGSDYYTLSKDARINYFLKLDKTKIVGKEIWGKLNLPEKAISEPVTIEYNLDHYFDSDYIRNLVIISNNMDLRGYAQNKNGFFVYNVYGLLGETRGSWAFSEEENKRCSVK